jgi:hypothetical protein
MLANVSISLIYFPKQFLFLNEQVTVDLSNQLLIQILILYIILYYDFKE